MSPSFHHFNHRSNAADPSPLMQFSFRNPSMSSSREVVNNHDESACHHTPNGVIHRPSLLLLLMSLQMMPRGRKQQQHQ
jgi:hypothetical protein